MAASNHPKQQLADRAKISGLNKLGQFRFARWANRRQIEWKISASVWAFLVAISSAMAFKNLSAPLCPLAAFLLFIVVGHFWWVHQNWVRNREDIKVAFDYFEEIHNLASSTSLPKRQRQDPRFMFQDAVPTLEFGITVLLSIGVLYLAHALPIAAATSK